MKEPSTLPDIQYSIDDREIALDNVGISDFLTRIIIRDNAGQENQTSARCSFSADLDKKLKGSHLSRFVESTEQLQRSPLCRSTITQTLSLLLDKLQTNYADLELRFDYHFQKAAPVSGKTALTGCEVVIQASKQADHEAELILTLTVPVSTTCPCSKAISEEGAHNQRANITASLIIKPNTELPDLLELYNTLEKCGSAPVYPLLKRPDEKFVTEMQYRNPKFVEDVARDVIITLRERSDIAGYSVHVESLESIHSHNAFASHSEYFE